jgi:hypothetical protein
LRQKTDPPMACVPWAMVTALRSSGMCFLHRSHLVMVINVGLELYVQGFLKFGELALHSLLNLLDLGDDIEAAVNVFEALVDHSCKLVGLLVRVSL